MNDEDIKFHPQVPDEERRLQLLKKLNSYGTNSAFPPPAPASELWLRTVAWTCAILGVIMLIKGIF